MSGVPRIYCGVWKRTLLEGEGLTTDRASTVLWLQTPVWHGDLRLPPSRPDFATVRRFADASSTDIRWLAQQQGFSGVTHVTGDICQWLRDVDFQPDMGVRDVGRMLFIEDGRVLEEYGVEADYHETWIRLPEGEGPCACWERSSDGGRTERLLVAGDCFFLAQDRQMPLPAPEDRQYPPLGELIFRQPHQAVAWLDLPLAFGRIVGGGKPWQILHATLPWLEGKSLTEMALGNGAPWVERLREAGAAIPPFKAD